MAYRRLKRIVFHAPIISLILSICNICYNGKAAMKKILYFVILIFTVFVFSGISKTYGDELDDINTQLKDLRTAYNQSKAATAPLEAQLNNIKERVAFIEADLARKKREIDNGYKNLEAKKIVFDKTVARNYIDSYNANWLSYFLSSSQASEIIQNIAYQKAKADQDKVIITNIALSITDLEEKKINLESEEIKLAAIKVSLDKVVTEAKAYQATLSGKIAVLSARQQEILNQRLANLNIPRSAGIGAVACVDDREKDPGFSGTRFAFFTYGVPNRTGLNQYGAKGRAASQGHEDILRAYYENIGFETRPNVNIKVQGYGEMPLETYLLGIYEMPEDWPMEALKAQVIAARSYALSYTNNGANEICTTQSCQVYKQPHKSGQWVTAVSETAGKVMVQSGQVIKAWYSSTHGGYVFPTSELPGWSATSWTKRAVDTITGSAGNFGDLHSNSYDRDSPWFYCDWGSRANYNKTAWLKPEEIADIANIILLARAVNNDSSITDHFYQPDKPHPKGGEVWNPDRVKSELKIKNITPFENVTNVVADGVDFGGGRTTNITVSGNITQGFGGSEFKDWFNLRAPANIQIVGPLYDIERN